MLKVIALAGVFVFTSAVSTAAVTGQTATKTSSKVVPSSPQPQGFCFPGTC